MKTLQSNVALLALLAAATGCGNPHPPKAPVPAATVTDQPQTAGGAVTCLGPQTPSAPAAGPTPPVPASAPELKSFAASLRSVRLNVSAKTSQVTLSFSHLNAEKVGADGLPVVTSVDELRGTLAADRSAVLEDESAPAYAARLTCADPDCAYATLALTLKSGPLAGKAKIAVRTAPSLAMGITIGGPVAAGAEGAFETQSRSPLPSLTSGSLYQIEGGKVLFAARTEISSVGVSEQSPDYFEKRILMVAGSLGTGVTVELGDLVMTKAKSVPQTAALECDVTYSLAPFRLFVKPKKSGISSLEFFLPAVAENADAGRS